VGSILGRILSRLEKSPINPGMRPPTSDLLEALAPEAPLPLRPLLRRVNNPVIGMLVAQVRPPNTKTRDFMNSLTEEKKLDSFVSNFIISPFRSVFQLNKFSDHRIVFMGCCESHQGNVCHEIVIQCDNIYYNVQFGVQYYANSWLIFSITVIPQSRHRNM
jgi:hypothetical protein